MESVPVLSNRAGCNPMPVRDGRRVNREYDLNHIALGCRSLWAGHSHDILAPKSVKMIDIDTLLAWGAVYKKLGAEETIFREDCECHFYHQLVSGSVRWTNLKEDGGEFIQNMIEPGESFGELPLFDGSPYAASAITNKESVVIRLHTSTFRQMMKQSPEIYLEFLKIFAERMRFKFLLLKELSCSGPEHRISSLFSYLKKSKKSICRLLERRKAGRSWEICQ